MFLRTHSCYNDQKLGLRQISRWFESCVSCGVKRPSRARLVVLLRLSRQSANEQDLSYFKCRSNKGQVGWPRLSNRILYNIWRKLRVDRDLQLQLSLRCAVGCCPFCLERPQERSDTATKLFWNCQLKLRSCPSQAVVLGRILHLFAVVFHRESCYGKSRAHSVRIALLISQHTKQDAAILQDA